MNPRYRISLAALAVVMSAVLILLAACGEDDDDDGPYSVSVILSEWAVNPEEDTAPAGEVRFTTTNAGEIPHELVIIRTGLPTGDLPTLENGLVDAGLVDIVGRVIPVEPGDFERGTFGLEAGRYVLICNLLGDEGEDAESHYLLGMHAEFFVE